MPPARTSPLRSPAEEERRRAVRRAAAARRRIAASQHTDASRTSRVSQDVIPVPEPVQRLSLALLNGAENAGPWWNLLARVQARLELTGSEFRGKWQPSCMYCTAVLLDFEGAPFCCKNGQKMLPPLPALPPFLQSLQGDPVYGHASLRLNQIFHFAVQGYSGHRIQFGAGPPAFAIQGSVYQRLLPLQRESNPLHMFLYNPSALDAQQVENVPSTWVSSIRQEIELHNPLLQRFREFAEVEPHANATLELSTEGPAREVAAVLQYGSGTRTSPRSILIHMREAEGACRLHTDSDLYEPLAYPVLFPHGTLGWPTPGWKPQEYFKHRLLTEARFLTMWRLTNLYAVDMLTRLEEKRLDFVASSLAEAQRRRITPQHEISEDGDDDHAQDPSSLNASLPSSFIGSKAYRAEQVADAMELARRLGRPHGMITLTTNPQWPELQEMLCSGQNATDVPHVTIRVFRARLHRVIGLFKKEYGKPLYIIKVIEFQKRGLPHAHIVFALQPECPISCVDKIASGEVPPDTQPRLKELVLRFMVHSDEHLIRASGEPNTTSRCYKEGRCVYGFPQPISEHTILDPGSHRLIYRRRSEHDRMIAQYSPVILLAWEGHAHIDFALSLDTFVYIFKYINKGPDYCDYRIRPGSDQAVDDYEEAVATAAEDFQRARYISATEATWRLFGFTLTTKEPSVDRLGVHLPGQNTAQYRGRGSTGSNASKLMRYFLRPSSYEHLKYAAYWESVTSIKATPAQITGRAELPAGGELERSEPGMSFSEKIIRPRQRGVCVARIKTVRPGAGEVFYLRQLLLHRPARSWRDIRTTEINGHRVIHPTFQAAAVSLGLFENTSEASLALQEAIDMFQPPHNLRFLYTVLIVDGATATQLWDQFRLALSRDFLPRTAGMAASEMEQQQACDAALRVIASILDDMGLDPAGYGLPRPEERSEEVAAELEYFAPRLRSMRVAVDQSRAQFNPEQRLLYDTLLEAITSLDSHKLHLIQGRAGRGKTFVIHAVLNHFRSLQQVVAVSGATGLCASAFERGSTAHRLFGIPVRESTEEAPLVSTIMPESHRAAYLRTCQFVIIDEVWALHRSVVECIDELFRQLTGCEDPFGGKAVIVIGDPRQTAPIVRGGSKLDVLANSFLASPLFTHFKLHELTVPVRTGQDMQFSAWVDAVGEDQTSSDVDLSTVFAVTKSVAETIQFLFPIDVLEDPHRSAQRAFLSPFNADVTAFNNDVLGRLPGERSVYNSFDTLKGSDSHPDNHEAFTAPETLNALRAPGVPAHELALKIGAICLVMRNLAPKKGLVKNAKAVVLRASPRVVVVRLLHNQESFALPRINFEFQPPGFPFAIVRKQIPLRLGYALTFNGCQGATLERAVIDARMPVFAHGQRYASVSRCREARHCLALLAEDGENAHMVNNIVYPELTRATTGS